MYAYLAYGLRFASNLALPSLNPQKPQAFYDFNLELGCGLGKKMAWCEIYRDSEVDTHGRPILSIAQTEAWYRWLYADGTQFLIRADGRHVLVEWAAHESLENALSYFVGAVFRFLLLLHGRVSLHASVVGIDGQAVLFVGESGMGKSTLAAAFSQLGYPILSDDLAALRLDEQGRLWVERGFRAIRLWPEAAALLLAEGLPRMIPQSLYWHDFDKRQMETDEFAPEALPVAALYFLRDRQPQNQIQTANLLGQARLVQLMGNTNTAWGHILPQHAILEFDLFSHIANSLKFMTLSLPNNGNWRLYCAELLADFRQHL